MSQQDRNSHVATSTTSLEASAPQVWADIYLRVSSKQQEENYSLPDQLRHCEDFCRRKGYSVRGVYNDGAQRSYTLNRPGLNAVRQDG